jgi:hypothetical protein
MTGGFRYLVMGLVSVVAIFAGLSLWPVLEDTLNSPAPQAAAQPHQPAAVPLAPPPVASQPPSAKPSYTFHEQPEEAPKPLSWLYTQRSAILRIKPGGTGHRAATVSCAPLRIATGTRLWPVKTEGDWVMLRSPSGTLGWMHVSEVGKRAPYVYRSN